jgi:hypothetical protein
MKVKKKISYLMNIEILKQSNVIMFNEMIRIYIKYYKCSFLKDKMYSFCELIS